MDRLCALINQLETALGEEDPHPNDGAVSVSVFHDILCRFGASADHVGQLVADFGHKDEPRAVDYHAVTAWLRARAVAATAGPCPLSHDRVDKSEGWVPADDHFTMDKEPEQQQQGAASRGAIADQPRSVRLERPACRAWVACALARARSSSTPSAKSSVRASRCQSTCAETPEQTAFPTPVQDDDDDGDDGGGAHRSPCDVAHALFSDATAPVPSSTCLRAVFEALDVTGCGWLSLAHLAHSLQRRGVPVAFADVVHAASAAGIGHDVPLDSQGVLPHTTLTTRHTTAFTLVSAVDFAVLCAHLPSAALRHVHCLAGNVGGAVAKSMRVASPPPPATPPATPPPAQDERQLWMDVSVSPDTPTPPRSKLSSAAPSPSPSPLPAPAPATCPAVRQVSRTDTASLTPFSPSSSSSVQVLNDTQTPRSALSARLRALDEISRRHYAQSHALARSPLPCPPQVPASAQSARPRAVSCSMRRAGSGACEEVAPSMEAPRATKWSSQAPPRERSNQSCGLSATASATSLSPSWSRSRSRASVRSVSSTRPSPPPQRPPRSPHAAVIAAADQPRKAVPVFHITFTDIGSSDADSRARLETSTACGAGRRRSVSGLAVWRHQQNR